MVKQQTIAKSARLKGVGLHTGKEVNMRFKALDVGSGIRFCRTDLEDKPIIKADVDYVVDVSRGTTLEHKGVRVATVEHVLAAVVGMDIDNILIELDAEEVPIMDGSSQPFVRALKRAGIQEQDREREYFEITEPIQYKDEDNQIDIIALPNNKFELTCMIDFEAKSVGTQHARLEEISDFPEEIANARTFCFLHELEALYEANLIRGGDLNNAIVIVDREVPEEQLGRLRKMFNKDKVSVRREGILNNKKLRYSNEPARHKLLDMVGDLSLSGKRVKGKIIAQRPGHAANIEMAKLLKQKIKASRHKVEVPKYDPSAEPVYDINGIKALLPHRFPILLVDKIIHQEDKVVIGVKNVTGNEHFFEGHFPGMPIMPGVLQIEAMAQTGGILVMNQYPDPQNYTTLFLRIEKARFKRPVVPGDTLIMKMELLRPIRRGICEMQATGFVGDKVVTEAELVAQVRRKPDAPQPE
jgi:UDP-3-O-[3-hydroxymyristoyl] N-acetylglucosamine deacetylase/3-hydroxyacyl-[acyl-carrier-protein] dehydratase